MSDINEFKMLHHHSLMTAVVSHIIPSRISRIISARWDDLRHVYAVNPLSRVSADFRDTLRRERDEAARDSRLKARFLSYRLNVPSGDEATMLLTVADWERVVARPVGEAGGRPVVGVDLGGGRAWSAAVALWRSGRMDAVALAPGLPGLDEQEKRDRVPAGTYRRLAARGALSVSEGLRVPPAAMLIDAAKARWGVPLGIVCDRFRINELHDANPGCPVEPRVTRWSEAAADIRALRKMARDGPLSCAGPARGLVAASLGVAMVRNDDQGNCRLAKRGTHNEARDDVAAALLLAAGALARTPEPKPLRWALV